MQGMQIDLFCQKHQKWYIIYKKTYICIMIPKIYCLGDIINEFGVQLFSISFGKVSNSCTAVT